MTDHFIENLIRRFEIEQRKNDHLLPINRTPEVGMATRKPKHNQER